MSATVEGDENIQRQKPHLGKELGVLGSLFSVLDTTGLLQGNAVTLALKNLGGNQTLNLGGLLGGEFLASLIPGGHDYDSADHVSAHLSQRR